MLANFQTNRTFLALFIGLERSMMDFLGKKHHLWIIFLASPNDVRLTSKLYRMYKKESSTRFWVIQSRGALGCYRWKSEFQSQTLSIFFDHVPYIPYLDSTWKVDTDPNLTLFIIKTMQIFFRKTSPIKMASIIWLVWKLARILRLNRAFKIAMKLDDRSRTVFDQPNF
jgi:hypothetical protein